MRRSPSPPLVIAGECEISNDLPSTVCFVSLAPLRVGSVYWGFTGKPAGKDADMLSEAVGAPAREDDSVGE